MASSVLIAEDNAAVRILLVRLVRRACPASHIVDVASGLVALEMARRDRPGVVLLDHGLPDINGFLVLERLKQQVQAPYTIMITGDAGLEAEAFARGADEVWLKPMDVPQMLEQLRQILPAHPV